jgi:hypothetical protein
MLLACIGRSSPACAAPVRRVAASTADTDLMIMMASPSIELRIALNQWLRASQL